jgi:hypothetical protein
MKIGSHIWGNSSASETARRNAFSWLTRSKLGPSFGDRPIGWYQAHQCAAIDELERRAVEQGVTATDRDTFEVRVKAGEVEARVGSKRWKSLGSVNAIYSAADAAARR